MPRFSPSFLHAELADVLSPTVRKLTVALSGGLDSTVLLHALAELRASDLWSQRNFDLRAIHIDHQLQSTSLQWSEQCMLLASSLSIPCSVVRVEVNRRDAGIEAAARHARYAALLPLIGADDALLTAHHASDQLETVLLALMRGSGPAGLAASPRMQPFGQGWLVRPLLAFTREDLAAWAQERGLTWIEDPTNANIDFDRNFLRGQVTPLLQKRWPAAPLSATRSAMHLAETSELLATLAEQDVAQASVGACLDLRVLRLWPSARRRNALRLWIKRRGVRAPTTRKLIAVDHDILAAQRDRIPCIELEGAVLRRHRDLLYCDSPLAAVDVEQLDWRVDQALQLPAGLGALSLESVSSATPDRALSRAKLPPTLTVRFRQGGESLRPSAQSITKALKKLLQESAVLPWWRPRLPLVYAGDALVGVGDLWIDTRFAAIEGEPSCRIAWHDKPLIQAISRSSAHPVSAGS